MTVSIEVVQLAFQLSQAKLGAQASVAIGADARALGVAAANVAVAAITVGFATAAESLTLLQSVSISVAVLFLLFASGVAAYTSRPREFYFPGAEFGDLSDDFDGESPLLGVLLQLGEWADEHIEKNNEIIIENARSMNQSYGLTLMALIVMLLPNILLATE